MAIHDAAFGVTVNVTALRPRPVPPVAAAKPEGPPGGDRPAETPPAADVSSTPAA